MKALSFSLIIFFISANLFSQSVYWTRVYHDDYGRPLYTGGTSYSAPAFADIDDDGDYDYFMGCRNGTIWFFENVGTPDSAAWHFVTEKYNDIYFDYFSYTSISFADVDADDDFDMFIGGETYNNPSNYGIHFFRNDGDPYNPVWNFVTTKYHNINTNIDPGAPGNPHYSHTQFADIDNEGDLDLFFISRGGRIAYYENTGNDSLPNYVQITENMLNTSFGQFPHMLEFADIDADNDFDLFIDGTVFYRNTGTPDSAIWNFETYSYFDLDYTRGAAALDIDNDLDLDMFVGFRDRGCSQFENIGTPDSAQWQLASLDAFTIDVGDLSKPSFVDIDNDGLLEMFITRGLWNVSGFESIWFYENNGTASAPKWTLVSTDFDSITYPEMSGVSFVDIDNDGDYDMFLGDIAVGGIIFHENFGNPTSPQFSRNGQIVFNIPNRIFLDPAFADIDADGDYDMFISERDAFSGYDPLLHYYRNDGDPYQPVWTHVFSQVYPFGTVTFFDEDGDGDLDMFYGGWGYANWGELIFYENIGNKYNFNFQLVTGYYDSIEIGQHYSPAFADIDSDGDLDLMIGEEDGGLNLFINDGPTSIINGNNGRKEEYELKTSSYPNPFGESHSLRSNPFTTISFTIPSNIKYSSSNEVNIIIYNSIGQIVREFKSINFKEGKNEITWDGKNEAAHSLPSGVYFYQVSLKENENTIISAAQKIIKLK